jgi:hypothetical protein
MKPGAWRTHKWLERVVVIEGIRKREHVCSVCKRRLVESADCPGKYFAAYASIFDFEPLAPQVTVRWLNEPCPGRQLLSDEWAFRTRSRPPQEAA